MRFRLFCSALLLFSVIFMPFWVSVILLFFGIAKFTDYYEGAAIFLVNDLLYGAEREIFFNILFFSSALALALIFFGEILKTKLRFYPERR